MSERLTLSGCINLEALLAMANALAAANVLVMGPESIRRASSLPEDQESAATREAFEQAEAGELMTLSPELMDHIAETGEVPPFVRDPR